MKYLRQVHLISGEGDENEREIGQTSFSLQNNCNLRSERWPLSPLSNQIRHCVDSIT